MLQLAERLRLDLANAFACHRELLADFRRVVVVHADTEAHAQHALLAWLGPFITNSRTFMLRGAVHGRTKNCSGSTSVRRSL